MTVLCLSLDCVLMVASFWAEAAVKVALTDLETGSDSAFSFSLLFVMFLFLTTGWQYFSLSSYAGL